jgi:hypothetical protein
MEIRLSWVDSGAPEYSVPTPFAFEMVRVDASRRVTFSAEMDTAFSLEDAFFVGAMGFGLVFALVAISKCLEEFKDKRMLAARHAFKINHVIAPLPHGATNKVQGGSLDRYHHHGRFSHAGQGGKFRTRPF